LGAVDFLYKPVDPRILKSKVDVFVQLHRQKQQLTEQLRLNELLTAAIGHDLRNPLQTILVGVQILQVSPDERVRWAAERIYNGGMRMSKLIADLMDFSSARLKGTLPVEPVEANLAELTQKVVAEHELADPSARIEVRQRGDLQGVWDGGRISQALSNLIGNALSHGDRNEPVCIDLDGRDTGTVAISVSNKGVIPAAVLPHIFDPFHSSGSTRTGASGLGLGLYIVQQIVNTHRGQIVVNSVPSSGTEFTIRLPRSSVVGQPAHKFLTA
jgi:signal transduction histidine kinase